MMSRNLCISTSYPCFVKEKESDGEMKEEHYPVEALAALHVQSPHRHPAKHESHTCQKQPTRHHKKNYSCNNHHKQQENETRSLMGSAKRNHHAGNECLFASATFSSKSFLLAFLLASVTCVSFCSASDTYQHPFSVEDNIDTEATLIDSNHHSSAIPLEASNLFHVIDDSESDCVKITMDEGIFHYKSRGGSRTCGIYMVSDPDKVIAVTIDYLDVQCQQGGLISVVDGWELNGAVFPSYEDHEKRPANRFHDICVESKQALPVRRVYTSSQNAALIQYRIPVSGQGFSVRVEHIHNPRPCNILVQDIEGIFTLENYGRNVNCSLMTIFDAKIRLIYLSSGVHHRSNVKAFSHSPRLQKGIYHKCSKLGMEDFVQIGGATSLDTSKMEPIEELCGYQPHHSSKSMTIFCGMTTIRLVSSGKHSNKVVAEVLRATIDDLDSANYICDLGLDY